MVHIFVLSSQMFDCFPLTLLLIWLVYIGIPKLKVFLLLESPFKGSQASTITSDPVTSTWDAHFPENIRAMFPEPWEACPSPHRLTHRESTHAPGATWTVPWH